MKFDLNGELRIPAEISRKAGFAPGAEVDVVVENGALRIVSLDADTLRQRRFEAALKALEPRPLPLRTADEVMALTRGED